MKTDSYKDPYDKVPVVIQVEDDDAEGLEKVICGECGSKMKRIKVLDYLAFGCNKRLKDVDKCQRSR